jgi:glyoxylase-like metal-dependent hydrolase (beta-lactamase superfamily II)
MTGPKITVGNVEIISLVDLPFELPWSMVFPGRERSEIEPYQAMYPVANGKTGVQTQAGAYALRTQGKTVLIDTGFGPGPIAFLGGARGRLLDDMRDKGVDPESIDLVAITHLHGDHVGWNLDSDGKPNFPNARYLIPQGDWDYFNTMLETNRQMEQVIPLKDLGRMDLISGETELTADVQAMPTPGHTPGHTSFVIASGGEKAVITGDLAHHPAQLNETDWCPVFDDNSTASSESRKRVCDMLEADGVVAAFCHFPAPFGKLIRADGKRVFQAL